MLGEGFITMLPYREQSKDSAPASPQSRSPLCRNPNQKTKLGSISLKVIKEMEKVPGLEQGLEQIRPPQPSPSVLMPSDPADRLMSLELYRSWHCTSFCKDYPDLQLRGDHMVDRDSERLSPQYVLCGGPLHSQDLGDPEPPQPPQPPQPGPAPLGLQAVSDDGYLEMDSSITLDKREPLSNSMLNCYLESKLLEVYRQHLQDSLARSGFPVNPALLPSVVLPSVDQLSRQLSMEQGLEVSVARNVVTNYLSSIRTCTGATSSHFSSPVLRISKPL
ncbi:protein CXorf21 homolog [Anguilla anguilla]|uniref:protein CXorf21 homolog n=1 Tax=Anguilla anguilla TaxID=7936 RepID=UPI0015A93AC1|nr:protein CXorf21 homolog [Anguilla anguilla]